MFAIEVQSTFSAAHALRLAEGQLEPLHGHDFAVTVTVACTALDAMETVIDFHVVERMLVGILAPWRNRNLNEIEPLVRAVNPSAERIAEHIGRTLHEGLVAEFAQDAAGRGLRVAGVRVTEAPGCLAIWRPESAAAPSPPPPPANGLIINDEQI